MTHLQAYTCRFQLFSRLPQLQHDVTGSIRQLTTLQVIFPGCAIPSPALAQPTFNDIKNFACAHRVDFVSAAYIQTAEDAQYLRRFMVECDHGDTIRLIARIENEVGLRNIDDILGEADGIMLCRTSLAFEMGPDKLGLMQKLVAAKAQAAGEQAHPKLCCDHVLQVTSSLM